MRSLLVCKLLLSTLPSISQLLSNPALQPDYTRDNMTLMAMVSVTGVVENVDGSGSDDEASYALLLYGYLLWKQNSIFFPTSILIYLYRFSRNHDELMMEPPIL